jgi:ankyrin repeat protein
MLLKYGAEATVTSKNGSTPLHLTCERKAHEKLIELLVSHGADINAKRYVDGKTPLHIMLRVSNSLRLESLLAYKPDVNAKDNDGNTPLHLAVGQYYSYAPSNTVQILLDAGADPNQKNDNMESPIHMMEYGFTPDAIDVVPILLNAGADLEARDNLGRTVLLRCLDNLKAVKHLLGLGANVGARDIYGHSALHLMCQSHNAFSVDLLKLLVEAGADPT